MTYSLRVDCEGDVGIRRNEGTSAKLGHEALIDVKNLRRVVIKP